LPTAEKTQLNTMFGGQAATVLSLATNGYVLDPNELNRNQLQPGIDTMVNLADAQYAQVDASLQAALTSVACTSSPVSAYCPEITGPDLVAQQSQFVQDLKDATAPPPPGANEPSLNSILATYANTGEPLWFVAPLTVTNVEALVGQSAWSVLTDPAVNPVLAPLLSPLMYIPALDMVPMTVGRITVGSTDYTVLVPIARDTLATKGLYQGRLVK